MTTSTTYTVARAPRTEADRAAFRWTWTVTLGAGQTDTISAEYDDDFGRIAVLHNGGLVAMYEGLVAEVVEAAIDGIYS
jgi:hypothetical protein